MERRPGVKKGESVFKRIKNEKIVEKLVILGKKSSFYNEVPEKEQAVIPSFTSFASVGHMRESVILEVN